MTKEEILQYIKSELTNEDVEIYLDVDDYKVIVEALEQEPIIDKIRAEIESLERFELRGEKTPLINGDNALNIIDKYKAEMESEDGN